MHPARHPRAEARCLRRIALVLALAWCGTGVAAEAQTRYLELRIEAAFLYNFAKFVEWTGDSGVPSSTPVTFCVLGNELLHNALEESLAGKTINGRALVAQQIGNPRDATRCQIVFVGWTEKKLPELLDALGGRAVLTVSDNEQFARHGGMIQLNKEGNKFRFAINVDAVNCHGLRISSKLLQLAEVVHEAGVGRGKP